MSSCPTAPTPTGRPRPRRLSVWASTQSVFGVRREIANMLGLDEDAVVVRAPAVGGGFGAKGGIYVEQLVVAALAGRLGRAVAWVETRNENLLNMTHGRGQVHDVEVGARRDGTIVGLAVRAVADVGAYPIRGSFIPMVTRFMASGTYRIPEIVFDARIALEQHDADRALSRRGPARSRGPRRADDGRARARAGRRARRDPASQLHPTCCVPVPHADGRRVRHRRLRPRAHRGAARLRVRPLADRAGRRAAIGTIGGNSASASAATSK